MKDDNGTITIVEVNNAQFGEYSVRTGQHMTLIILATQPKCKTAKYRIRLCGRGAKATIVGIVIGGDSTQFSLHTLQQHEAPETTSNLLVKTVLSDRATFAYDGGIRVEKKAQKTDAYQRNENLLLSGNAHAESKPSLEILANDVRCTHGATVGQISKDQLWYLATRGVGEKYGHRLIVSGFLESCLEMIDDVSVTDPIKAKIASSLA